MFYDFVSVLKNKFISFVFFSVFIVFFTIFRSIDRSVLIFVKSLLILGGGGFFIWRLFF